MHKIYLHTQMDFFRQKLKKDSAFGQIYAEQFKLGPYRTFIPDVFYLTPQKETRKETLNVIGAADYVFRKT